MGEMDDVMLPGFRFHPTDEELVGFYLKRKVQHQTLPAELIKQVDIYKYDPWDLPKLAYIGEKEWYFYCPRDRKYRNSERPNRVALAGFWKATGTDRPVYSSNGVECIGLRKSLVFYRGRAAKGIKTDWMMHEFRLPPGSTSAVPTKSIPDKILPPNDSWAICRIFKKVNTRTQQAHSRPRVSHMHETPSYDHMLDQVTRHNLFSHEPMINPKSPQPHRFPFASDYLSALDMPKSAIHVASASFTLLSTVLNGDTHTNRENIDIEGPQGPIYGALTNPLIDEQIMGLSRSSSTDYLSNEWGNMESPGFPLGSSSDALEMWKTEFIWNSAPSPSDTSTPFPMNRRDYVSRM